jgi:WD40 repeat protein
MAGTTWPRPCQAVAIPGRRIITTTRGQSHSMSTRRYFPIHHSIRPPSRSSTRIPRLRPRPPLPPSSTTLPTMHPASARVRVSHISFFILPPSLYSAQPTFCFSTQAGEGKTFAGSTASTPSRYTHAHTQPHTHTHTVLCLPCAVARIAQGHTGAVYCVGFAPSGRLLASGSFDKSVRLWDLTQQKEVRTHPRHSCCPSIERRSSPLLTYWPVPPGV